MNDIVPLLDSGAGYSHRSVMRTQMPEPVVPPVLPPIIDPPPDDEMPPLPEHDPDEPDVPPPLKMGLGRRIRK